MILYHYPMSPYSHKIRALCGFANIDWHSLEVSSYPPRPTVETLTGGYGRIPVAQIGADIFCDSQVIVEEIVTQSGNDSINIKNASAEDQTLAMRVESEVFFAIIPSGSMPKLMMRMALNIGPIRTIGFIKDRIGMMKNTSVKLTNKERSKKIVAEFLDQLEVRLNGNSFLNGNQASAIDFICYHPLWMLSNGVISQPPKNHKNVMQWMQQMDSFAKEPKQNISDQDALLTAKNSTPRPLPTSEDSTYIGKTCEIGPSDYRIETVQGQLVAETSDRWIIKRQADQIGDVHVHFPKHGYQING